jgi:DNA topoisomerase IA
MAAYAYQTLDANISSPLEGVNYKKRIEIPTFSGWKQAVTHETVENDQSKGMGVWLYLKSILEKSPHLDFNKIISQMAFHNRHSHYTESSLIKNLEDFGIGRPSTFAIFIETILERGYVKKMDIEG